MNLPVEVINAIREGNCLVFVGSRFTAESRSHVGLPMMDGRELAKHLGWRKPRPRPGRAPSPVTPSVRSAAGQWESSEGREDLLRHLGSAVGADSAKPSSAHRFIMRHFNLVFSTVWDDLFEQAAEEIGRTFQCVAPGALIPEATVDSPVLVRMRGGFTTAVVVTRRDEKAVAWGEAERRRVREILRKHVVLFVGYRPDEEEFELLFERLTEAYGANLPRCHLAVAQGNIDDYQWQRWVWRGLLLFTADPEECTDALGAALTSC